MVTYTEGNSGCDEYHYRREANTLCLYLNNASVAVHSPSFVFFSDVTRLEFRTFNVFGVIVVCLIFIREER